eukprot:1459445-Amphidinium_carterae.2
MVIKVSTMMNERKVNNTRNRGKSRSVSKDSEVPRSMQSDSPSRTSFLKRSKETAVSSNPGRMKSRSSFQERNHDSLPYKQVTKKSQICSTLKMWQGHSTSLILRINQVTQHHQSTSEAAQPITVPAPQEPSAAEGKLYNCTHIPFRSWCEICVRSSKRSVPQMKAQNKEHHSARLHILGTSRTEQTCASVKGATQYALGEVKKII